MMPLSEPEGDDSDCSSYEELSSTSEAELEEEIVLVNDNSSQSHRRKDSTTSTSSANYRSWTATRRRGSKPTNVLDESVESLALICDQKGWWYWTKLALFMATPFIARQLGIFVGKRILSKTFNK